MNAIWTKLERNFNESFTIFERYFDSGRSQPSVTLLLWQRFPSDTPITLPFDKLKIYLWIRSWLTIATRSGIGVACMLLYWTRLLLFCLLIFFLLFIVLSWSSWLSWLESFGGVSLLLFSSLVFCSSYNLPFLSIFAPTILIAKWIRESQRFCTYISYHYVNEISYIQELTRLVT